MVEKEKKFLVEYRNLMAGKPETARAPLLRIAQQLLLSPQVLNT
jgi:hypothetical protein